MVTNCGTGLLIDTRHEETLHICHFFLKETVWMELTSTMKPKLQVQKEQPPRTTPKWLFLLVGATGFEPATTRPPV